MTDRPSPAKDRVTEQSAAPDRQQRPNPLLRLLRTLSGVAVAGLFVLTGIMAFAAWLTDRDGAPGPSADIVLGHLAVAVLALVAQIVADRSDERPLRGVLAALAALALAATALWVWWWN